MSLLVDGEAELGVGGPLAIPRAGGLAPACDLALELVSSRTRRVAASCSINCCCSSQQARQLGPKLRGRYRQREFGPVDELEGRERG